MNEGVLRHELKHTLNFADFLELKAKLPYVMTPDKHAVGGKYHIRGLYFDNYSDKALCEKLNGIDCREKFRLRYYGDDISSIRIEKKGKVYGLCTKISSPISAEECRRLLDGDTEWMLTSKRAVVLELYGKMRADSLRPCKIVDYTREPYIYKPGNVRVTLDYDIRQSSNVRDFLNPQRITAPASDAIILEVKYDNFLPQIIRDIVQLNCRTTQSFSKYAVARLSSF